MWPGLCHIGNEGPGPRGGAHRLPAACQGPRTAQGGIWARAGPGSLCPRWEGGRGQHRPAQAESGGHPAVTLHTEPSPPSPQAGAHTQTHAAINMHAPYSAHRCGHARPRGTDSQQHTEALAQCTCDPGRHTHTIHTETFTQHTRTLCRHTRTHTRGDAHTVYM